MEKNIFNRYRKTTISVIVGTVNFIYVFVSAYCKIFLVKMKTSLPSIEKKNNLSMGDMFVYS